MTREKPLILIVDDEQNLREIFSTKLNASGFETAVVSSGEEAVQKTEELLPDLVLMDIKMRGMTGTDAALAIKENPKTEGVKIAFFTSQTDPWPGFSGVGNNEEAAQELGIDDFLTKTDDLDLNVKKIQDILARPPRPPRRDM